jgi:thiamine biosynthesis lipoprotein
MKLTTRRSFLRGLAVSPVLLATPALAVATSHVGGSAFGTYWRVLSAGSRQEQFVEDLARSTFSEIDRAMSPYNPTSDLSRFNMGDGSDTGTPSADLLTVADAALALSRISGGAFDPTVGPTVGRFGFGPISGPQTGNWRGIAITDGILQKSVPGLTLDLCGIAKGYAIDKLARGLMAEGMTDWLIDLGGELRAMGQHPSGRDWRASVANPFVADGQGMAVLSLGGRAVATSGITENGYDIGGRWVSHLIDPVLVRPIDSHLLSVSVLSSTAMRADGLATMLTVMGPERGVAFARANRIDALFLNKTETGHKIVTTGNMNRHLIV